MYFRVCFVDRAFFSFFFCSIYIWSFTILPWHKVQRGYSPSYRFLLNANTVRSNCEWTRGSRFTGADVWLADVFMEDDYGAECEVARALNGFYTFARARIIFHSPICNITSKAIAPPIPLSMDIQGSFGVAKNYIVALRFRCSLYDASILLRELTPRRASQWTTK